MNTKNEIKRISDILQKQGFVRESSARNVLKIDDTTLTTHDVHWVCVPIRRGEDFSKTTIHLKIEGKTVFFGVDFFQYGKRMILKADRLYTVEEALACAKSFEKLYKQMQSITKT